MSDNVFRPPEPRSGWAKARMRHSQEGGVRGSETSSMKLGVYYYWFRFSNQRFSER